MKRSVLILLASVLIFLTACRSEAPVLKESFRSDISVTGGSLDFSAALECSPGSVVIEITSPPTVAGIRYTCTGGELHTSYGSLDSVSPIDSLPVSAAPSILCEALADLSRAEYDSSDGDTDVFRLALDAGEATIAAEDGDIRSIAVDYSPYVFSFTPAVRS